MAHSEDPPITRHPSSITRRPPTSEMMKNDPYTLFIAIDGDGSDPKEEASGKLFIDDEKTYDYKKGKFDHRNFVYKGGVLENVKVSGDEDGYQCTSWIERLVFMGVSKDVVAVTLSSSEGESRDLEFTFDKTAKLLVVKKPNLSVTEEWKVAIMNN